MPKGPEAQAQRAILEYLAATRVLAFRQNTGAIMGEHKGKTRFMRFGSPGMADIQCWHPLSGATMWLEVKSPKGKQSEAQMAFQQLVESHGHIYAVVRSVDDVIAVMAL